MPNWLGDFVMAASVIGRMSQSPDDEIHLLVPTYLTDFAKALLHFPVIAYKRKTAQERSATLAEIKTQTFDRIILLPHSFSSALFALRTGIKNRRGISTEYRSLFLTDRLTPALMTRSSHLTAEYSAVVDVPFVDPQAWQGIPKETLPQLTQPYVVFCPGARYGRAKQWPGFGQLAQLLTGIRIIILGSSEDFITAEPIATTDPDRITNLCGTTDLVQAADIIAHSTCVISNDSGLMHVAGYLGKPTIALFGSTSPDWTKPLGSKSTILYTKQDCSPCFKRTCKFEDYHCLTSITAQTVAGFVLNYHTASN